MKHTLSMLAATTVVVVLLGFAQDVSAQYSGSNFRNARSATRNYLYNRPTVSPYLNLTSRDSGWGLPNYYTQVRPRLEQEEQNIAAQRRSAAMQQQLNQVQDQVHQSQQQAADYLITGRVGWSSRGLPRFGSYLSFYPGFQVIPRR